MNQQTLQQTYINNLQEEIFQLQRLLSSYRITLAGDDIDHVATAVNEIVPEGLSVRDHRILNRDLREKLEGKIVEVESKIHEVDSKLATSKEEFELEELKKAIGTPVQEWPKHLILAYQSKGADTETEIEENLAKRYRYLIQKRNAIPEAIEQGALRPKVVDFGLNTKAATYTKSDFRIRNFPKLNQTSVSAMSKLQSYFKDPILKNHRPAENSAFPVTYYNSVFNNFMKDLNNPNREVEEQAIHERIALEDLITVASGSYPNEKAFVTALLGPMKILVSNSLGESDPSVVEPDIYSLEQVKTFLVEVKYPSTGSDPHVQIQLYYTNYLKKSFRSQQNPCFLLVIQSFSCHLYGAITLGDSILVDLLAEFDLLAPPHVGHTMPYLQRIFSCLKKGVAELKRFPNSIFDHQHFLITPDFPIVYDEWTSNHPVLFGSCTKEGNVLPLVIKVAQTYGTDAHGYAHSRGYAPALYYVNFDHIYCRVFVVMERLDKGYQDLQSLQLPEEEMGPLRSQISEAVKDLHSRGFVHGDIRDRNIMYNRETKKFSIIDFDWAGFEGSVTYPAFINRAISWPEGVASGELILKDHDLEMVTKLG